MQEQSQQDNSNTTVLLTGTTGYLAGHVLLKLLQRGFKVKGSVRDVKNEKRNELVYSICPEKRENLELVQADLMDNTCWDGIMKGCDFVVHTASPFPPVPPKDEREIIDPAVNGTEAVMVAAIKNNIKKVVLTSSIASIFTGRNDKNYFTEDDWSNVDVSPAYEKSKHLAERKAWDIYKQNPGKIQLTTINPGYIQGPNLIKTNFTSGDLIIKALTGGIMAIPKVSIGTVDVRDVAEAHVRALELADQTDGNRYILNEGSYWMEDTISILRDEFGKYKYDIPSMTVGKMLFSCYACCNKQAQLLKPFYGRMMVLDNTKSKEELGIQYINNRKTILEMAYKLIEHGDIPDKINKKKKKN